MGWFELFCLLAVLVYTVFLLVNIFTLFPRKKIRSSSTDLVPNTLLTLIIAARNEEKNIQACLEDIAGQDFPKEYIEVVVVNDHSEDRTAEIAETYLEENFLHYQLLHLEEGQKGKKAALLKAIAQSKGDIIITRDADTLAHSKQWLKETADWFANSNCDLLVSPVLLSGNNSFSTAFQKYENLALVMLGAGMAKNNLPIVCSGANLAYKKETFVRLDPYQDNLHIASGDDMFLLKKAFRGACIIHSSSHPNSVVYTPAEAGPKNALFQRLRWASKTGRISILPVFLSGLTLILANTACLLAGIYLFVDSSYLAFGLFTLIIKLLIDFLLLFLSARMFNVKFSPAWYLPAFVFNIAYTPAIALVSLFVKPVWKGRNS